MPDPSLSFRIVRASEFLQTTARGTLDSAASRKLLLAIATSNDEAGRDVLIDLRGATDPGTSYREVYALVSILQEHPGAFRRKVAVLDHVRPSLDKTQFFQASATDAGFHVRTFIAYEEAARWLQASEPIAPPEA